MAHSPAAVVRYEPRDGLSCWSFKSFLGPREASGTITIPHIPRRRYSVFVMIHLYLQHLSFNILRSNFTMLYDNRAQWESTPYYRLNSKISRVLREWRPRSNKSSLKKDFCIRFVVHRPRIIQLIDKMRLLLSSPQQSITSLPRTPSSLTLIGLSILLLLMARATAATASMGVNSLLMGFQMSASGVVDRRASVHQHQRVRPVSRLILHAESRLCSLTSCFS